MSTPTPSTGTAPAQTSGKTNKVRETKTELTARVKILKENGQALIVEIENLQARVSELILENRDISSKLRQAEDRAKVDAERHKDLHSQIRALNARAEAQAEAYTNSLKVVLASSGRSGDEFDGPSPEDLRRLGSALREKFEQFVGGSADKR